MFNVRIPSSETYKISTRPAVLKSLAQALGYFNLDQGHKIYFNGPAEVSKEIGGLYNSRRGDDLSTDTGYTDKIFVEFESVPSEYNDGLDTAQQDSQTTPLFWSDPITGSSIRPIYSGRKYEVTINKYFKDPVQAERFHRAIRDAIVGRSLNTLFDVQTHFPVHIDILNCYYEVWKRLSNGGVLDPATEGKFLNWFRKHSHIPTDTLSNIIGENLIFVFKQEMAENGMNYGLIELSQVVKGQYIGQWEVSWNYSFYWNEHTHWELKYPIQIHQQVMPECYMPEHFTNTTDEYATRMFMESKLASLIFDYKKWHINSYHVLPDQDNWRPPAINWVSPQLQVLLSMEDVQGEQVILNIKEIQGFTWNPELLNWILKFHSKVTRRHANPLQFKLYSNEVEVLNDQLILRPNGDLVLMRPATLSNIYRLTFNLDYALRQYDDECIDDLVNFPDWGKWIIQILYPDFPVPPDFGDGGRDDWWDIHNKIDIGDGEEVDFFIRGTIGAMLIAYNGDDPRRPDGIPYTQPRTY